MTEADRRPAPAWGGVERAAAGTLTLVAILAYAATVRLVGLGAPPLDPAEASQSVAAWWAATGSDQDLSRLAPPPSSAVLLGVDAVAFWLAGDAGDGLARAAPAIAGAALVLLVLLRRPEPWFALLPLAVLLAADPWLVMSSRRASGAMVAAGAAVACHLLLRRLSRAAPAPSVDEVARRHWAAWAVAAGLLAASGPWAWDFLPPLAAAAVLASAPRGAIPAMAPIPRAGVVVGFGGAAVLVAATGGLVQWQGPSLVTLSLESWLASWKGWGIDSLAATGLRWSAAVVVYEIAVVALAAWGLARAWRRYGAAGAEPRAARVEADSLALWILWGAAMQLRSGGESWLVLQVPLLIGAALGVEDLLAHWRRRSADRDGGRSAAVLGAALAVAAGVVGTSGIPRVEQTLPAVRRLAADVAVLLERPAAERPQLEVETGSGQDAVLAWYLRDVPVRWVASVGEATADAARVVLVQTARRLNEAPAHPAAPSYVVRIEGERVQVVELR